MITKMGKNLITRGCITALGLMLLSGTPGFAQAVIFTESIRPAVVEASDGLAEVLVAAGIRVDIVEPLADPGDLSAYDCVFDLRIDGDFSGATGTRLTDLASAGGGIYMAGEHGGFSDRNLAIAGFIASLGVLGVVPATDPPSPAPHDIDELVNLAHPINNACCPLDQVVYDGVDNGNFLDLGPGQALTSAGAEVGAAVWDVASTRLVAALDINFLSRGTFGTLDFRVDDRSVPTDNRLFLSNVAQYLCKTGCFRKHRFAVATALPPAQPRSARSACSANSGGTTSVAPRFDPSTSVNPLTHWIASEP